jgi:hypothetical protein
MQMQTEDGLVFRDPPCMRIVSVNSTRICTMLFEMYNFFNFFSKTLQPIQITVKDFGVMC